MELVLRTAAVLAAAWLTARLLPRAAAATRHLLWQTALLIVVTAPMLAPLAPELRLPALGATAALFERHVSVPDLSRSSVSGEASTESASGTVVPWSVSIRQLWICSSLAVAGWFAIGWLISFRVGRRSGAAPAAWQVEATAVAARMGIESEVRLGMLATDTSPVTIGLFKPRILLPPAASSWTAEERRAVLAHELAHVARRDLRTQILAQAACAMYWFNPLAWIAAASLRRERELACDDEVLRLGATPSDYAACLLRVARLVENNRLPAAALAMARASELEGRLLAILGRRPRRSSFLARTAVPIGAALMTVVALGATTAQEPPAAAATSPVRRNWSPFAESPQPSATSVGTFVEALDDSSADVREKAALALALQPGTAVVDPLLRALGDDDSQVREKAAMGLALRDDPRVVEPLLAALADRDAQVREKAALALATTGDARARTALEAATRDPDAQVREKAVTGLVLLDTPGVAGSGDRVREGVRSLASAVLGLIGER